jgi:hypothetical protein
MEDAQRVKVWNTYFKLAWSAAKAAHEDATGTKYADEFHPLGDTLSLQQHNAVAVLTLCTLAIEARANHLIDELVEQKEISDAVGRAARFLPTRAKWFLLPTLAGKSTKLRDDEIPHQAVATICDLRDALIHVKFDHLTNLPNPGYLQSLFENFVVAMEDMNVVLGRNGELGRRPEVLRIGLFKQPGAA